MSLKKSKIKRIWNCATSLCLLRYWGFPLVIQHVLVFMFQRKLKCLRTRHLSVRLPSFLSFFCYRFTCVLYYAIPPENLVFNSLFMLFYPSRHQL